MLHMEIKKKILLITYFLISCILYAGDQTVNINLNLTYPGASAQEIGENLVIDLGFLKDGSSHTGDRRIEIGTISVTISQRKSQGDPSPCLLENIEFSVVDLDKLKIISERIDTTDTIYIGNPPGIVLSAEVSGVNPSGSITQGNLSYFVDPECLTVPEGEKFQGKALTELRYDFKLFADISNVQHGVRAAKAQDKQGTQLSIRNLIISQIRGTTPESNRRRNR
ncbi:hypothetical protein FV113G1_31470 [Fusobacterium varium]|nr:hypothetical protein FV113G1_31470 [Fusobacterium varium]